MFKDTTKEMKNTFDGHISRLNKNKKRISNLKTGKEKIVRMKYKDKNNFKMCKIQVFGILEIGEKDNKAEEIFEIKRAEKFSKLMTSNHINREPRKILHHKDKFQRRAIPR